MIKEILVYLPISITNTIQNYIKQNNNIETKIEEIRLRINQNLTLKISQDLKILNHKVTKEEISEAFENICEKSVYSYTKQISEGFITIKGGNRVGLTGQAVIENEKVININYISSLNFRISRQIKECSIPLLKYVIDIENNSIFNTLIVSPPGARKNNNIKRFNKKNIKSEYQK